MVFYRSFVEAIRELEEKDQLAAVWAIIDYGLDEKIPDGRGPHKAIYTMAKPQIDANNKRYINGTKGGRPKTKEEPDGNQRKPSDNQTITTSKPNVNDNVNVNDKKKDTSVSKEKLMCFSPPSVNDVVEYCEEKGYVLDAEYFVDFYTSKGWMVGKNKMKDWKAAVRNWVKNRRQGVTTEGIGQRQGVTTKGHALTHERKFEEHDYDMNELTRQLIIRG